MSFALTRVFSYFMHVCVSMLWYFSSPLFWMKFSFLFASITIFVALKILRLKLRTQGMDGAVSFSFCSCVVYVIYFAVVMTCRHSISYAHYSIAHTHYSRRRLKSHCLPTFMQANASAYCICIFWFFFCFLSSWDIVHFWSTQFITLTGQINSIVAAMGTRCTLMLFELYRYAAV